MPAIEMNQQKQESYQPDIAKKKTVSSNDLPKTASSITNPYGFSLII